MDLRKIESIDNDGVGAVKFGLICWTILLALTIILRSKLDGNQFREIISICVSGLMLGIFGYRYTTNRLKKIKKASAPNQSELIHDFE
jgi:NhaP-type Na+/H+ or K+/H+ antiporter